MRKGATPEMIFKGILPSHSAVSADGQQSPVIVPVSWPVVRQLVRLRIPGLVACHCHPRLLLHLLEGGLSSRQANHAVLDIEGNEGVGLGIMQSKLLVRITGIVAKVHAVRPNLVLADERGLHCWEAQGLMEHKDCGQSR